VKRRLVLIALGLWLVIWLGWPLVSPPTTHIDLPKIASMDVVMTALDGDLDTALEHLAKAKKPWRRWWDRIWRVLNFLFLAALLVKLLREPVKKFFADQRRDREEELADLERLKAEAEAEYQRVEDKLSGLSKEIDELKAQFAERADKMKDEVLEQARFESDLILRKAQSAAEARFWVSRERLRAEIIELAATEAERIVTRAITADDQRRMIEDYLYGLKAGQGR
jgi:F-type H+-transporting ATPase subunit b